MKMDMLRFVGASNVDFPLLGAEASGPFVLKSAEGLGPPEVTVKMARTVIEKGTYQGKTAAYRQIVAVVGLQPDWDTGQTPADLRAQLYSLLTPRYGRMVKAQVMYGGAVQGYAQGQLSRIEPVLFTNDPAVQITLECDYPYFLAPNYISQQPAQGTSGGVRSFTVKNDGTAPAGFLMGAVLQANVGNTLILSEDAADGQRFQVEGINWVAGDRFVIDTRAGSRGVYRGAAGGSLVSVLNNMNASVSEWLQLYGGDNTLWINTTAFAWDMAYLFQHQPAYWGV